jgi:hypothetical protein
LDLILSIFLAYLNGLRAKRKGQRPGRWALFTVLAFLLLEILGGAFVIGYFYKGSLTPDAITTYLVGHPIHSVFMWFCGFGGYLFIRYRIDKLPVQGKDQEDNPQ